VQGGGRFGGFPDDGGGGQVVEDEAELVLGLAPVGRAEDGAQAGAGQQELEDGVGVLAEPQDAGAGGDAASGQGVREAGDAGVELGVGEPYVAVHGGRHLGAAAGVLGEDVREGQAVQHRSSGGVRRTRA
jgi:hypothetical protein